MSLILKLLITVALGVLAAVAYLGLMIDRVASASSHVTSGIFASVVIVFIHCLFLFYLNGTARAIKDAVGQSHPDLHDEFIGLTRRVRNRAYPPSTFAILLILIAAFAGAYVHSDLLALYNPRVESLATFLQSVDRGTPPPVFETLDNDTREQLLAIDVEAQRSRDALLRSIEKILPFPVREPTFWWLHLVVLGVALPVNFWAFFRTLELVSENSAGIRRLNAILEEREQLSGVGAPPSVGPQKTTPKKS